MSRPTDNGGEDDGPSMPLHRLALAYITMLVVGVALAEGLSRLGGVPRPRAILFVCGFGFMLAAARTPRRLYDVFRNLSWFVLVPSFYLRVGFAVFGILAIGAALFG